MIADAEIKAKIVNGVFAGVLTAINVLAGERLITEARVMTLPSDGDGSRVVRSGKDPENLVSLPSDDLVDWLAAALKAAGREDAGSH